MPVSDALRDYAEEKIGRSMGVLDVQPLDAEVVLFVEKNPANPTPCVCEVTMRTKGQIVRVEECAADMFAAIDVAADKVVRQLRKYKTRIIDRKIRASIDAAATASASVPQKGLDDLMDELASDDEIVRVKVIEFAPMTEEEALINIDLLGHDFFVYTDRDTNSVHVLYRRKDGGYGLLKQEE